MTSQTKICLSNATDEQLKTIVRFDIDCPTHLLSGVVTEMMNRGLFEGLIKSALIKRFQRIEIASRVLKVDEEDIFQFCRMKIFETLRTFKQGMKSFLYVASIVLKRELKDLEEKAKAEKRKVYENIQSMNVLIDQETGLTFLDVFPSSYNVEQTVIKKMEWEERFKPLDQEECKAILLFLEGYSAREIGGKLGLTAPTANRRLNAALSKLTGRQTTSKELGIINYRKGA